MHYWILKFKINALCKYQNPFNCVRVLHFVLIVVIWLCLLKIWRLICTHDIHYPLPFFPKPLKKDLLIHGSIPLINFYSFAFIIYLPTLLICSHFFLCGKIRWQAGNHYTNEFMIAEQITNSIGASVYILHTLI